MAKQQQLPFVEWLPGSGSIDVWWLSVVRDRTRRVRSAEGPSRFVPPTIEEVEAYSRQEKLLLDSQLFWDFYESKGWHVGKVRMKDWRCAARRAARAGWAKMPGVDSADDLAEALKARDERRKKRQQPLVLHGGENSGFPEF